MKNFVHLHLHTEYSLLDGIGKPLSMFEEAKKLGFEALACTDHGNMDCYVKAIKASEKTGVKYVPGCEFYVVADLEKYKTRKKSDKVARYHFTAWAKNNAGIRSMFRMLTKAYKQSCWGRPTLQFNDVFNDIDFCEDVMIGTACANGLLGFEDDKRRILDFKDAFEENFFLEVMPHDTDMQKEVNRRALLYSKRHRIPALAVNDVHYINKNDDKIQEVLLAIQTKAMWDDPKRFKFNITGLYMKTYKEMQSAFQKQGVVPRIDVEEFLENTYMVSDSSDCIFGQIKVELPNVVGLKLNYDTLVDKTREGFRRIAKEKKLSDRQREQYMDRLVEELCMIKKMGFQKYFLLVEDLISWSKENDILVGAGRGSVGGSLVAYCIGITCVDPIEYGLLFVRFISPNRVDLPDIDCDFEDARRDDVKRYLKQKYGEDNVASVSVYSEMHGKGVLRDVSRVFNVPLVDVNVAAKSIVSKLERSNDCTELKEAFGEIKECRDFQRKYPDVSRLAVKLEGTIKNCGVHAAGVVVSVNDLTKGLNGYLKKDKDRQSVINWDKDELEYMGLMKLDVLGLNNLTILNQAKKLVKERYDEDIDFYSMKYDDKHILNEFNKGNTMGVFQFNTYGIKKLCVDAGVSSLQDLADINALYRPGTLRAGMVDEYVQRKKDNGRVEYIHEKVREITESTYGIIVYQEQVMNLLKELAGLPWKKVDEIRKVISKSKGEEKFMEHKKTFVDGCLKEKTLGKEEAEETFDMLKHFSAYSFNMSHAVEYSMIAYWCMFVKYFYPSEFYESILTWTNDQEKLQEYVDELERIGFQVHPATAKKSFAKHWNIEKDDAYPPIVILKGVGDKAAEEIESAVDGGQQSLWSDDIVFSGLNKRVVNARVMGILKDAGYYGGEVDLKLYPYRFRCSNAANNRRRGR